MTFPPSRDHARSYQPPFGCGLLLHRVQSSSTRIASPPMASPRLPFLYPFLFRAVRPVGRSAADPPAAACASRPPSRRRPFSTSTPYKQRGRLPRQRYGTANEPPPHLVQKPAAAAGDSADGKGFRNPDDKQPREEHHGEKHTVGIGSAMSHKGSEPAHEDGALELENQDLSNEGVAETSGDSPRSEPEPESSVEQEGRATRKADGTPLETVLAMPSPAEESDRSKPPHLQPPRYVHHFDTWGLVRHLEQGGFQQKHAVTSMKAVRAILADNMELAQQGLVSKSDVENESYLFRAACSELRTEIQNNRRTETENMRSQRNQLQHEVDILNQRMHQELSSLKDELKGLFDDRKMTVRMEQQAMENKIQELNYRITVTLNSEARSQVEGVRWLLTRRAAMAIAISGLMALSAIYMSKKEKEMEQPPHAGHDRTSPQTGGEGHVSVGGDKAEPKPGSVGEGEGILVSEGGMSLS
ncbi:hypothetical protein BDY21DRAFT_352702 [Lineolata rhizophorae]|uniref:MOZ protein represents a chromatin-associated acetyltransferase n=1 Tax=Lineolata rhizophorae TaxID=578093 RepID=A0A6A6NSI4_9PEZI|nr:hypothetical protein BDY21DRAFT_352702 [Lineolata rhizophorae]